MENQQQPLQKPRVEGAPGAIWRPLKKSGWECRWQARTKLVQQGYQPKSLQIWVGKHPNAEDTARIRIASNQQQLLMLGWAKERRHLYARRGKSSRRDWIHQHKDYGGDACLPWLYGKMTDRNHGVFGFTDDDGVKRMFSAQRYMCELVHGPKPSDRHIVSWNRKECRSCSCMNPSHLGWMLISEARDCLGIGKDNKERGRITPAQVAIIRAAPNVRGIEPKLALQLSLPRTTVRTWRNPLRPMQRLGQRGLLIKQVARPAQPALVTRDPLLASLNDIVPRFDGRDDVIQKIALAILEGKTSIEAIRAGELRKLSRPSGVKTSSNPAFPFRLTYRGSMVGVGTRCWKSQQRRCNGDRPRCPCSAWLMQHFGNRRNPATISQALWARSGGREQGR